MTKELKHMEIKTLIQQNIVEMIKKLDLDKEDKKMLVYISQQIHYLKYE